MDGQHCFGQGREMRGMESVIWPQATVLLIPDAQKNHLKNAESRALLRRASISRAWEGPRN